MKKKVVGTGTIVAAAIVVAVVLIIIAETQSDPAFPGTFTGSFDMGQLRFQIYAENLSGRTLTINHISLITSNGVLTTPKHVRIRAGALTINVPASWPVGPSSKVLIGCTYGNSQYVEQVTI